MEPERFIQFRVAWIDDVGSPRMNRGYRIQYSSAIGPYEGAIHLGHHVNSDVIKAFGFDSVFANALTGFDVGAAVGGADIDLGCGAKNENAGLHVVCLRGGHHFQNPENLNKRTCCRS